MKLSVLSRIFSTHPTAFESIERLIGAEVVVSATSCCCADGLAVIVGRSGDVVVVAFAFSATGDDSADDLPENNQRNGLYDDAINVSETE